MTLAGDLADCIVRAGVKRSLAIAHLPESITSHCYELDEPSDGSADWVEEVCSRAACLKEQLAQQGDLQQSIKTQAMLLRLSANGFAVCPMAEAS